MSQSDSAFDGQDFAQTGRVWLRGALDAAALERLRVAADMGERPGARVTRDTPLWSELASGAVSQAMRPLLSEMQPDARPVRVVSFAKGTGRNWGVPWHQDRIIAVKERHAARGYKNWSQKAGAWHCEPPLSVLEQMLFVRVHLDDNMADNGAMQIALGSHAEGAVAAEDAERVAGAYEQEVCTARAGDILIMSMLLLHRSGPSQTDAPRRVLRVDYGAEVLPPPLAWA